MLEDKKVETIRNKDFIGEYLFERGLSSEIMENPRYEAILWKLSNMLRKMEYSHNSEKARTFLSSIVNIEPDGSLIIIEGKGPNNTIVSSKYAYDMEDGKLKRFRVEGRPDGTADTKTISVYNDDGIEESLGVEQTTAYGTYFSKATRVKNRIEVIKIERMEQAGETLNRLPDMYQIRLMWAGLEDISPDAETIDPFDTMHFDVLGLPPIYRDLEPQELEMVNATNNEILPLPQARRQEQLDNYKKNNDIYGRTKAFEKGIAKYLIVKDRSLDD